MLLVTAELLTDLTIHCVRLINLLWYWRQILDLIILVILILVSVSTDGLTSDVSSFSFSQ